MAKSGRTRGGGRIPCLGLPSDAAVTEPQLTSKQPLIRVKAVDRSFRGRLKYFWSAIPDVLRPRVALAVVAFHVGLVLVGVAMASWLPFGRGWDIGFAVFVPLGTWASAVLELLSLPDRFLD